MRSILVVVTALLRRARSAFFAATRQHGLRRRRRAALATLLSLSPAALAELGIDTSDIARAAARPAPHQPVPHAATLFTLRS